MQTDQSFFKKIRAVTFGAVNDWFDERASSKGAALAFYTLFSMAPLLLIAIAIAGLAFGKEAAQGAIFKELDGLLGPTGAQGVQMLIASARDPSEGVWAAVVAGVLLFIGATSVFAELKDSLDDIWNVPPSKKSGVMEFIRTRFMSFGLVMVLAFLLLVSLVVSAGLTALNERYGGAFPLAGALSNVISFAIISALFAAIFKILPAIRLSWRDVIVGAVLTAALFILGKFLIGFYLGHSDVASSYGAAGSMIALLLWIYYSAQIFFMGAEFTRHYAITFGSLKDKPQAEKDTVMHKTDEAEAEQKPYPR